MIPIETFRKIATELRDKSKGREVNWKNPELRHYTLKLGNAQIHLQYFPRKSYVDSIQLLIQNSDGTDVGLWRVENGDNDWELMVSLFSYAERPTTGWDSIVSDIETRDFIRRTYWSKIISIFMVQQN